MQIRDPKPEVMRLEELALLVKSGDIKLPRFQRPFVWKEADMLKLLDSLYKGYPIGSILIWNSSQKLKSERSISGLEVDTEDNTYYPTNYLLDGQQRLTTLCGALFWNGLDENSKWNIHFDLERQEFVHPRRRDLTTLFPLNRIINTRDFISQCMKFEHHDKRDEFFRIAERLLKSIKDYKIAVVKIGDMTIDEVAPIFERINSTGRKLTIVDLMMAATWSNGFDLTAAIQIIRSACAELGFEDLNDQIILRTISASAELGINKDDIQKLREKTAEELTNAANDANISLSLALRFLRDEIGVRDFSYIPYGIQLTYLAEFFRLNPAPAKDRISHLKSWFWFTSATRYFGTSTNTGQVAKDIASLRAFAIGKSNKLFENSEIDISQLLYDKFNLRNATSTTFTLLLNDASPTTTLNGKPIDGSHLKMKSNKFFGTFAPILSDYRQLNIAKIIYPYSDREGDFPPSNLLVELEENLLDDECAIYKQNGNSSEFLVARSNIIAHKVESLTGCKVRYSSSIGIPDDLDSDDE
jgi:hypothetical protein